ncbi:2,3,4,5-tetrahydropyridine-2,6-dicarboxylate N-acetyltransferase [Alkalibacterium subtropicum]|uniref:2,3,4,5-tetrahydropyridine-2,6-dicarboxylate N-acetyltransferase n=1 Tax=Alkalibacterium subtropicum TaxID=753702 RepID=A0A1I1JCE4_9LACT|nr:2,3,4,5-tetrahydropyridine-2,6-dicarboxylate N-acetyltransferase [Alkalibacterium subtropicum]SFC46279.1 2,3,4,5-tetrahydropyridine-2,6-dicarboxylate N-acetyltransferase [Alkalibacterium subtropicum]
MQTFNPEEIIEYISRSEKTTPLKIYINTTLKQDAFPETFKVFGSEGSYTIFADLKEWRPFYDDNNEKISALEIEQDRRHSAIPLLDTSKVDARIEPGSFIRDHATIGKNAVVMMGAVINIGAVVGEGTMIDMGAVLGGRATTGKNVHVGAGAVLSGVIEPASATPVIIEDNVLIGANAVILEGVRVGKGSVVAAGAIVTEDVPADTVVAGVPARKIKNTSDVASEKVAIISALRELDS